MRRTTTSALLALLGLFALAPPAWAEDAIPASVDDEVMPPPGYLPGHQKFSEHIGLGLSPHVPGQQSALPGGIAPVFGAPVMPNSGGKFDFKGHLQLGGRAGIGKRSTPKDGQSSSTWHGDPIVPRGNVFENTNVVPYVWSALEFSYSLPTVTATVNLGAWNFSESMQAAGAFNLGSLDPSSSACASASFRNATATSKSTAQDHSASLSSGPYLASEKRWLPSCG